MKLAMLKNPVFPQDPPERQISCLGMNTGNLVFWESLIRLFNPDLIPYYQSEKLDKYDCVIITDLIWIRPGSDYSYLEKLVDTYPIPFVPMSIGLQNSHFDPHFKLDEGTVRLLKKLEERAVLGVRGHYTADVLAKHGIKNIQVIGCPSMYYWNNPQLQVVDKDSIERVSANFKTFFGVLSKKEKRFLSYCAQRNMQFIEQTQLAFKPEMVDNDMTYYRFVDEWLQDKMELYCTYKDWQYALRPMDFSIGGRFHGNVLALQSGVKSLFLTSDSRTQELTEYFALPTMTMEKFDSNRPIEYYYDRADYSAFNAKYPYVFERFVQFANANKLPFTNATPLSFK